MGRTWPNVEADVFTEVSPDDWVTVIIMPETVKSPDRLFAHVAEAGGGATSDLKRLVPGPNGRAFKMDFPPGKYHVRAIGYWDGGDVEATGMFSLEIPGKITLAGVCEVTLIGGGLDIALDSLDDPMRTAYDAANRAGCGFNLPIVEIRLTLGNYTETFRIEQPSQRIGFPLGSNVLSVATGGPLAPGEYSRRLVAVSDDGQEWELTVGNQGGFKNTVILRERE